jgi:hypothetical protein
MKIYWLLKQLVQKITTELLLERWVIKYKREGVLIILKRISEPQVMPMCTLSATRNMGCFFALKFLFHNMADSTLYLSDHLN